MLALVLLGAMDNLLLGYCIFLCHFGPTNPEFDMLHYHIILIYYIALICYTLLHCFCSATFLFIWIHTTFLNDESRLSETSVTIWTNIVLLRFQLWTAWNILDIQLRSSLSQSKWSFFFFFIVVLHVRPFLMTKATTQHFLSPWSTFLTQSRITN
jgi:hypothetical protein